MESTPPSPAAPLHPAFDAVVIAASLGGLEPLAEVLGRLPADFPAPILVVHHIDARSPGYLPAILTRRTQLAARHPAHGESLRPGTIYVAPPGRHLLVRPDGSCAQSDGPRVSFARPAADPLFTSAAEAFGARTLAVILSGRLHDGAAGAAVVRRAGGVILVQDPSTCRAAEMPRTALRQGTVHLSLPPRALGAALVALVTAPGMRALLGFGTRVAA